jgi:hypothetical protein
VPYLTPDEIPEGDDCRPLFIPDDTAWLAIVSGALTELTQKYNWEQFGTVTVDEAVARMQTMVDQYYEDACGECLQPTDEPVIGIDEDGHFVELINGEWVDPTGIYTVPSVPARTDPTSDERMCLAARNAVNVLSILYEQALDDYEGAVDPLIAWTGFFGNVSTEIAVALGWLTKAIGGMLTFMWSAFYSVMEFLTEDSWDEEFTEKLVCALRLCANDNAGVVTFDYNCVLRVLTQQTDFQDPSFGDIRILAQLWYIMLFIGVDGLNLAGATTAITVSSCPCDTWCQNFDYTTTPSLEDWNQYIKGFWNATEWEGVNSTAGSSGGGSNMSTGVQWDVGAPFTITRIDVNTTMAVGSSGIGCDVTIRDLTTGTVIFGSCLSSCGTNAICTWVGSRTLEHLAIWVNGGRSVAPGTGSAGATALLHAVRIYGTGENPFAEGSNC